MTIQEQRCPRCAIRRTAHLGDWGSFCFNCRLQWRVPESAADAATLHGRPPQTAQYLFEPAQLLRLERYRAAIQAGLYTDCPVAQAVESFRATAGNWSGVTSKIAKIAKESERLVY